MCDLGTSLCTATWKRGNYLLPYRDSRGEPDFVALGRNNDAGPVGEGPKLQIKLFPGSEMVAGSNVRPTRFVWRAER